MIKAHVFHTTSQYLVIIWITGLKILTGDITHYKYKNYYFPLENIIGGQLHGELSTPGLNSALLTGLKFSAITVHGRFQPRVWNAILYIYGIESQK
jgi:hypothetical protein